LLWCESRRTFPLIIGHAPYEANTPIENHFVKYFYGIQIGRDEWPHFDKIDKSQEGSEVHIEELNILAGITKVKDNSKEEPTAKENSC